MSAQFGDFWGANLYSCIACFKTLSSTQKVLSYPFTLVLLNSSVFYSFWYYYEQTCFLNFIFWLLLVFHTIDFKLILYPDTLLKLLLLWDTFSNIYFLWFCTCRIMTPANKVLLSPFQFDCLFFPCNSALARSSITKSGQLYLFFIFEKKHSVFYH